MTNDNKLQQNEQPTAQQPVESKTPSTGENNGEMPKKVRIRLIPVWLRVILVIVLFVAVTVLGLMFGFSVLGDGNATDALKWSTWQHMIDIMKGVE